MKNFNIEKKKKSLFVCVLVQAIDYSNITSIMIIVFKPSHTFGASLVYRIQQWLSIQYGVIDTFYNKDA